MNKNTKKRIKRNKIFRIKKHLSRQHEKKIKNIINKTLLSLAGQCFGCVYWSPTSEKSCKFTLCLRYYA